MVYTNTEPCSNPKAAPQLRTYKSRKSA
jgi:hypothetical protein